MEGSTQSADEKFMRMALLEAMEAYKEGEIPVGAVIVSGGRVIGRGHNMTERLTDVTAHAEIMALTAASSTLGGKYLPEATIYVTVEPCTMCAGALAWSQIGRIVYGAPDTKRGFFSHVNPQSTPMHPKTLIEGGLLEDECKKLMQKFFRELRR